MVRVRRLRSKALTLGVGSLIASLVWCCVLAAAFDVFRPVSGASGVLLLGLAGLALGLGLAGTWIGHHDRAGRPGTSAPGTGLSAFGALVGAILLLLTILGFLA